MGGRGGSSHRGGGGSFGRGHLAEWTDNESALRQIMRDTGLPEAAARQVQQDMIQMCIRDRLWTWAAGW